MRVRWGRRGEAWVGTGVILIVMLLAGGTAASAILDAVNNSAERAEAVAADAVSEITTGISIRHIAGMALDGRVVLLELLIALQAGSPPIRLDSLIVHIVTPRESVLLETCDYDMREILILGAEDGILERGEIAKMELGIPGILGPGDSMTASIIVPQGQTASERITVPNAITDGHFIPNG